MQVCASLMSDAQPSETVKPSESPLNDPTPLTEPFV
jgi:hypothetical protein